MPTITINDSQIWYERKGDGETLIFVHGGLVDSRVWDAQMEPFSAYFDVIRYDLAGFGKSTEHEGAFSHVDDLLALMDVLNVEKAHLCGLSMGGQISTELTLAHPERVEKLVLVAASLRGYAYDKPDAESMAKFRAAMQGGRETAVDFWLNHPTFSYVNEPSPVYDAMKQMLSDNHINWSRPGLARWDDAMLPIDHLQDIQTETLVIIGTGDRNDMKGIADTFTAGIPNTQKVIIKDVGHHPCIEKPIDFNSAVLDFLK